MTRPDSFSFRCVQRWIALLSTSEQFGTIFKRGAEIYVKGNFFVKFHTMHPGGYMYMTLICSHHPCLQTRVSLRNVPQGVVSLWNWFVAARFLSLWWSNRLQLMSQSMQACREVNLVGGLESDPRVWHDPQHSTLWNTLWWASKKLRF